MFKTNSMEKETIENYCKTIHRLDRGEGVKSIDIAKSLGLSKISVSLTLHKLKDENYVEMQRYGKVRLSCRGKEIANKIDKKHKKIVDFLINCVGLDEKQARIEACAMEHHLSKETVEGLVRICKEHSKRCCAKK
jgi:DtxR family transcriptional regulator, Mn-dependent transcriptional regulator